MQNYQGWLPKGEVEAPSQGFWLPFLGSGNESTGPSDWDLKISLFTETSSQSPTRTLPQWEKYDTPSHERLEVGVRREHTEANFGIRKPRLVSPHHPYLKMVFGAV